MEEYLLDKNKSDAENRLSWQEKLYDPVTIEILNRIGVKKSWDCLEIGGGKGSITSWLCLTTGEKGKVTAVDLDAKFLTSLNFKNLEVIEADIMKLNLGDNKYDLIHARDVLVHIKQRKKLISRLVRTLKKGGWILLEEPDVITDSPDPGAEKDKRDLYTKTTKEIYRYLKIKGLDPFFGRRIPGMLIKHHIQNLHAEGRTHYYFGGKEQIKSPHMMAFEQLKNSIIKEGTLSEKEYNKFLRLADDPLFCWREGLTMSAWGQK